MHSNLNLLLHQNLPYTAPSPSSSTSSLLPRRSKRRPDHTKHGTIQKDGVRCYMGADDTTGLLSSARNSIRHACYQKFLHPLSFLGFSCNIFFAVVKLISKSASVLLEDEGSKTSSERQNETVMVLLKLICSLSIAGT